MGFDEMSKEEVVELLEQERHELRTCKKRLAFEQSFLAELEFDNAELSEVNQKFRKELLQLKESRAAERRGSSSDDKYVDDGYGHWSADEDELPAPYRAPQNVPLTTVPKFCRACEALSVKNTALIEQAEELRQQLDNVRQQFQLLQEQSKQKKLEIAVLTVALENTNSRVKELESELKFNASERQNALRDLHDIQYASFMSAENPEAQRQNCDQSIGISIGDELGAQMMTLYSEEEPTTRGFVGWDNPPKEPKTAPPPDFVDFDTQDVHVTPPVAKQTRSDDQRSATQLTPPHSASETPSEVWNGNICMNSPFLGWRSKSYSREQLLRPCSGVSRPRSYSSFFLRRI